MANKKNSKVETTDVVVLEKEKSTQSYYFYSVGCGFCKKAEPIVDELIKEGHDILKLDTAEPENKKIVDELKKEYKVQCGTPWFITPETGKGVCGFREKDVLEKWLAGEDIPAPPRPKGQMPRPPFMGVPKKEETAWKKEYKKWTEENSHMPNLQTAEQILERPRPKTEPPKPPNPQGTDAELDAWGKGYDKWKNENSHLPNLQPVETILQRFKQQRDGQGQGGNPSAQNTQVQNQVLETKISKLEKRINELEKKINDIDLTSLSVDNNPTDWELAIEDKLDSLLDHLGV
jgi:thiol-disulfide isomerase/thioredoxin